MRIERKSNSCWRITGITIPRHGFFVKRQVFILLLRHVMDKWKRLKNVPVKEARLIGEILGHTQLGVGDWWYARRIEYYLKQGKIHIVEDSENKYARIICKETYETDQNE